MIISFTNAPPCSGLGTGRIGGVMGMLHKKVNRVKHRRVIISLVNTLAHVCSGLGRAGSHVGGHQPALKELIVYTKHDQVVSPPSRTHQCLSLSTSRVGGRRPAEFDGIFRRVFTTFSLAGCCHV